MTACIRCHRSLADALILPSGMCTSCDGAPPGPVAWAIDSTGTSEETRAYAEWESSHPETWKEAMIAAGRWPGRWRQEQRAMFVSSAEDVRDRAEEALRRGCLNPDGTPCVGWWCAGGFDHPLGAPYYEVPGGDPRHNCYCVECAKRIEAMRPIGL